MNVEQQIKVNYKFSGRAEFIQRHMEVTKPHSVLHVGCADAGMGRSMSNILHHHVSRLAPVVDGFDTNQEALKPLIQHFTKSTFYTDILEVAGSENRPYDLVLVPEVLEHVDNVGQFLTQLRSLNIGKTFLFTVPAVTSTTIMTQHFQTKGLDTWVEIVHPDHNCWYSPYTLKNVIKKYLHVEIEEVYIFQHQPGVGAIVTL